MNRRRDQPKTPTLVFCTVFIAFVIMVTGGVLHALCKNRQIQVRREIDAIERRVEHCRLEIRTAEMRMDQLLNRFVIRKQLEENGSDLRPIPLAVIEEIGPSSARQRVNVASAAP